MSEEIKKQLKEEKVKVKVKKLYTPSEKKEAVALFDKLKSSRLVSEEMGIAQSTINGWIKKRDKIVKQGKPEIEAFQRKSRRPHNIHYKISSEDKELIVSIKEQYPFMGPTQIKYQLARFHEKHINHISIGKIIEEAGFHLQRGSKKEKLNSPKRFEAGKPLELVQMDFKDINIYEGNYKLFCILDDHSRYILHWHLDKTATGEIAISGINSVIENHGKPENILADQGVQWCSYSGKTRFEKHVEGLNINMIHARSHHPQTCGKVESLFRTLNKEVLDRVELIDFEDVKKQLASWVEFYNVKRCHSGIGGVTPADRFKVQKQASDTRSKKKIIISIEDEIEIVFKKAV